MSRVPIDAGFQEDDLLPLSALADLVFCERRAALHLIEHVWEDNLFTIQGSHLHERAHDAHTEARADVRIARGLAVRSLTMGLSGKADVVEFHRLPEGERGARLNGVDGFWRPFPVEYKRGSRRHEEGYEVQLCAQAMCIEEMLGAPVPEGAIFFGATGRRLDVPLVDDLRARTREAAARLHALVASGATPRASYAAKCDKCSLLSVCMPKAVERGSAVGGYLLRQIASAKEEQS